MVELDRRYTAEEITEKLKEMSHRYPAHLSYRPAGESADDREIPGVLLGDSPKCLLVSAGIHGRESANTAAILQMIETYALIRENEYSDPLFEPGKKLLREYSIYFLPLMNPDGYEIALGDGGILQNAALREKDGNQGIPWKEWKGNGRGVDINRNFPCASFLPREGMEEAASEPETRALIRAFAEFPESVGYLDVHSRGKVLYYYRRAMTWRYNRRGKRLAKRMQKLSGYRLGSPREERETTFDGGNSVNYYSERYGRPAVTVETVADEAGFPMDLAYQKEVYREIRWLPLCFLKYGV